MSVNTIPSFMAAGARAPVTAVVNNPLPACAPLAASAAAVATPVIAAANPPPSFRATELADQMNRNRTATWRELGEYHALTGQFFSSRAIQQIEIVSFQARDWSCIFQTLYASFPNLENLRLYQTNYKYEDFKNSLLFLRSRKERAMSRLLDLTKGSPLYAQVEAYVEVCRKSSYPIDYASPYILRYKTLEQIKEIDQVDSALRGAIDREGTEEMKTLLLWCRGPDDLRYVL